MLIKNLLLWSALAANCVLAEDEHHHGVMASDDDMDMNMASASTLDTSPVPIESLIPVPHVSHHHHGLPILETDLMPEERLFWENYNSTVSYFRTPSKHKKSLYAHVLIGLFTIIFVYPITLVFKNLDMSSWYVASLLVHSALMFTSLFTYSIFINSIPVLYPGNAYNKMSWILLFSTIVHLISALIKYAYAYNNSEYCKLSSDEEHEAVSVGSPSSTLYEFSRSNTNSMEMPSENNEFKTSNNSMLPQVKTPSVVGRILALPIFRRVSSSIYHVSNGVFNFLNWGHFFFYLAYVPTGLATFLILGQGNTVFNLLAHFIKGGVFFAYGILTLARYSGAFKGKGWAWNHHFITSFSRNSTRWNRVQSKGLITMEFVESSLILFYGCTNIFLEHLADAGQEWSPKDLQHASIAFIFIGCGLCGVITEVKLNTWRYEKSIDDFKALQQSNSEDSNSDKVDAIVKAAPGFSPNPFPVVTIFWTGILMSKHQQDSATSTEIHTQWGNMFILGCAFRLLTYLMVLIAPVNKSLTRPSRPFTELLVSFGLLCGGLIFMESTDPVVLIFEYYGLTSMLTLNVSLGVVALFMGWEMSIFAFKDWLSARKKN